MSDSVLYAVLAVGVLVFVLQLVLLQRSVRKDQSLDEIIDESINRSVAPYFRSVENGLERVERELREEMGRGRLEATAAARGDREEQAQSLDRLAKTLSGQLGTLGTLQGAATGGLFPAVVATDAKQRAAFRAVAPVG